MRSLTKGERKMDKREKEINEERKEDRIERGWMDGKPERNPVCETSTFGRPLALFAARPCPPPFPSLARSLPLSALILHHSQFGRLDPFSDYASQESPAERASEGGREGKRREGRKEGTVDDRSNGGGPAGEDERPPPGKNQLMLHIGLPRRPRLPLLRGILGRKRELARHSQRGRCGLYLYRASTVEYMLDAWIRGALLQLDLFSIMVTPLPRSRSPLLSLICLSALFPPN